MTTYAKINLSALTLANETLTSSQQLVLEQFVLGGAFSQFHSIIPNIKFNKEVGLLGEFGVIGKTRQGCEPTADTTSPAATLKTWTQYSWETILDFCFADLLTTIARYDLKNGTQIGELEGTAYFNVLMDLLGKAINKMLWRVWLMDTAAAHSDDSPAGVITPAIGLDYMNLGDGYWKQIYAIVAGDANRKIAIAANSEATYALQTSALTPTLAYGYLEDMTYGATPALRGADKGDIWFGATRSLWDKAAKYLQGLGISETYFNLVNGVETLRVNGFNVMALDIWDEQIRAFEDNGTSYNKPHRAFMTTKDNILFGVPSSSIMDNLNAFYIPKDRIERIEASDDFSPLILQNDLTMTAY